MISIDDLHHDYLLISKMKMPIKRKVRLLTELFGQYDDGWRVIGITKSALQKFIESDFKRIPRMGIQRAHITDRVSTYTYMFENVFYDADSWWEYHLKHDETILSTSSENMSSASTDIIYFDNNDSYFKGSGFSWGYRKKEQAFLKEIAGLNE
ncbi:hypothetical protein [Marinomonas epiphytica]